MLVKIFDKIFLKFIIVGIINTMFGTVIMFLFYNFFDANYWISSVANYFFGSILSYYLNNKYTFKSNKKDIKTFEKFIVNICICYLIAYGVAKPLIRLILINYNKRFQENIAMLIGMILFVLFNYIGQRFFTFKESK
ncbi:MULTISPECIES: GtrA family protein [unclassified Clostridium]|uniref:GtrA family protein n=1 Tax=unclassified Clostridium TaxID=2614128 RepID=UPI001C8B803B|nr:MULTISPECIES: GtrA family protein [unclassified Clostridium]MBX9136349.1 GtrA family protein [Clostridium sp. K12(2020)]MBX9143379.1 GtrA family protein [Clostridium sp. K13]